MSDSEVEICWVAETRPMKGVRKMAEDVPSRFEQLWGVERVAEYLDLTPATLYGWRCKQYGPPSYRLGNKVRYRPEEVREWVTRQKVRAYVEEQNSWAS